MLIPRPCWCVAFWLIEKKMQKRRPLRYLMTSMLLLFALLHHQQQVACQYWVPITQADIPQAFAEIYFPQDAYTQKSVVQNYYIFHPMVFTEYYEYCSFWEDQITQNAVQSCEQYFCSNDYAQRFVHNASETQFHVNMHNYCLYCVTHQEQIFAVQQFVQFRNQVVAGKCPHFFAQFNRTFCGGDSIGYACNCICNMIRYTMLYTELYNSTLLATAAPLQVAASPDRNPYLCYCKSMDQYGYQCDAFSMVLIGFKFFGSPWIIFMYSFTSMVVLWFFLVPECVYHHKHSNKCGLPLRVHVLIFAMMTSMLLCVEQAISLIGAAPMYKHLLKQVAGIFRILSFVFLLLAYTANMIYWSHRTEQQHRGTGELSRKNKYVENYCEFIHFVESY